MRVGLHQAVSLAYHMCHAQETYREKSLLQQQSDRVFNIPSLDNLMSLVTKSHLLLLGME